MAKSKRALVLSGGGMFGAWQAGAWRALADRFQPDLVVGASVGSLNGYAIAGGATPDELIEFWHHPEIAELKQLPATVQLLMNRYTPRTDLAVVLTDMLRMKPCIFLHSNGLHSNGPDASNGTRRAGAQKSGTCESVHIDHATAVQAQGRWRTTAISWQHLAASCAIPGVLRQYRIDGRWYGDGGLLNALPIYAAVDLGATHIVALHPLWPRPAIMKPLVRGFLRLFGHYPDPPSDVEIVNIKTDAPLGSLDDALKWRRENVERWVELGYEAARSQRIAFDETLR